MGQKLSAKLQSPRRLSQRSSTGGGQASPTVPPSPTTGSELQSPPPPPIHAALGLEKFFHGEISRDKAEKLLRKAKPGDFLVRYSATQKAYCVSFVESIATSKDKTPTIAHNLIYHLKSGAYSVVAPAEMDDQSTTYPDLKSFVEAYQRRGTLKTSIPRTGKLNREISTAPDK